MLFTNYENIWLMRIHEDYYPEVAHLHRVLKDHEHKKTRSSEEFIKELQQEVGSEIWKLAREIEEFNDEKSLRKRFRYFEKHTIKKVNDFAGLITYEFDLEDECFYLFHTHVPYKEMVDDGQPDPHVDDDDL